ncbi:MAG: hypothetical protein ABIT83_22635 [Massilia sp.]
MQQAYFADAPAALATAQGKITMPLSARDTEAQLMNLLVEAARENRSPSSNREADLFRFAAQLLKSRYPHEANTLDAMAKHYFSQHKIKPRSFPQVVSDGLVSDVARLRHMLENRMAGIRAW